jgi:hypothetical protein
MVKFICMSAIAAIPASIFTPIFGPGIGFGIYLVGMFKLY